MPEPINAEAARDAVKHVDAALENARATRERLRRTSSPGDPARDNDLKSAAAGLRDAMSRLRPITGALGQGARRPKSLELSEDAIFERSREADKERRRLRAMLKTR